mgnify:CR=1 FL=1
MATQHVGEVPFDQRPVDARLEQRLNVLVAPASVGLVEDQILDVADAGHQVDAEQMREREDGRTLRVRIAVDHVRLDVRRVLDEPVEDVDGLMHAARDEVAEERDVLVRDVVVADAAITAVADVVFGQQILLVEVPLRAVGRHAAARAPELRQRELVIRVDDFHDRLVEPLLGDVAQIEPGDLLAAEVLHRAGGLRRAEIATVAEQRRDEALARLVDLGLEARERAEELVQIEPLFGFDQDVEDADRSRRCRDGLVDERLVRRVGLLIEFVENQALLANLDVIIFGECGVDRIGERAEFILQLADEGRAVDREVDEFAVAWQFVAEFVPRHLVLAGVVVLVAVLDVYVARVEFAHDLAEHAQLEVLPVQHPGWPAVREHGLLPFLREPIEWQLRKVGVA